MYERFISGILQNSVRIPFCYLTLELATMGWVHWWNTQRLHEALGYTTPTEVEAVYTHHQNAASVAS